MIYRLISSAPMLWVLTKLKLPAWENSRDNPIHYQQMVFKKLIRDAKNTRFGKEHGFHKIRGHGDFVSQVPIREYEAFVPYIERIMDGELDVLYPGKPRFFAKTSGTIADTKYIPVTSSFAKTYSKGGLHLLFSYMKQSGQYGLLKRKLMFLQGSTALADKNGIPTGRMSGISWYLMPKLTRSNRLPSFETNCIENWSDKIDGIVEETMESDFGIQGGQPPWVLMYFDRLLARTGKANILELFPNLRLYVHGGVNFEPYRDIFLQKIGGRIDTRDTYTASEGFFGFQELADDPSMTLCTNNGVFYEFIPLEEIGSPFPTRLPLQKVEAGKEYAIVISTGSGLWAYLIGDKVKFTSVFPFRLLVTGRIGQSTSIFGEQVTENQVRNALQKALSEVPAKVKYFTVAPCMLPVQGQSHHQWWIEFEKPPLSLERLESEINRWMKQQNFLYHDRMESKMLQPLKIVMVQKGGFIAALTKAKKIDGQSKIPVLSNNREMVDCLEYYRIRAADQSSALSA